MSRLQYVYAVLPRSAADRWPPTLGGIDEQPVRPIAGGDLVAAVGAVPASDFDEAPLNERIRDLQWLGPRAVAHQQVNGRLFERAESIVPLSFGTVFRSEEGVRAFLREEGAALRARLERLRGQAEWVLSVQRDSAAVARAIDGTSEAVCAARAEMAAAGPGRAYLLRRQLDAIREAEARRLDVEAAQETLAAVERCSSEVYRESLPPDAPNGLLLRASVLVPRAEEGALEAALGDLRRGWEERGYAVTLSGPWPPYRFAGLAREAANA